MRVVNQMPYVTLANAKKFVAANDKTILLEANANGIVLEYSCRTGRCGVCKAQVVRGETHPLRAEEALTAEELHAGVILTCCRAADTDVDLDIEDLGRLAEMAAKTVPCRIDSLERLALDVIQITLRLPPASKLNYLSGQYVDIIWQGARRSYSIANAPQVNGKLTLQIRHVEQGLLSHYWFNEAKADDLLRLEGPLGTFCLRTVEPRNLIFLATGTGIAPVKAMLEELATSPELTLGKNIHVYWGGRSVHDIYWQVEFKELSFNFIPVLSRPSPDWGGRCGYVQQALLEDEVDLTDAVVYACGSDNMIHSARKQLTSAGLHPKKFYSDAFVSSN